MAAPAAAITRVPHPTILDRAPAAGLVIVAILAFQLGAVVAKPAIESVGPIHPAFVRTMMGAVLLLAWKRPAAPLNRNAIVLVFAAGLMMLMNTLTMFAAIERIPVGIAMAIGFWGPMMLALHGSRHVIDVLWVGLAICGILLFTPLANASFDTLGVALAIIAGAGFGATLVFSSRLGHAIGPIPGAGLAMVVGSVFLAPLSFGTGLVSDLSMGFVGRMLAVGVLFSVFGNAVEFTALTRVRPSLYAILISLEPAVGAILGVIILGEHIGWVGAAGIGAVSMASIGASRTHRRGIRAESGAWRVEG
jgi:inner membrane transporter RhtA